MERVCRECGSLVNGEAKFCPVCGKVMERAVELTKQLGDVMPPVVAPVQQNTQSAGSVGSSAGYGAPQYGSGGVPQNISPTPKPIGNYKHMSTGEWVLMIIVCSFFGLISLILNIVWGFGSDTPEPKRTYCRASFYISLVTTILGFIVGVGYMIYIGVWLGGAF